MARSRRGIPKHDGSYEAAPDGVTPDGVTPQAVRAEREEREERIAQSQGERERRHGHRASPDAELLSAEGLSAQLAREALREENGMSTADKIYTEWSASRQPLRPPGRYAEPSGNHPEPSPSGQLASGHMLTSSVAGAGTPGLNYSTAEPRGDVRIEWHAQPLTDASSPMHSALRQHVTGQAVVSELDQAAASQPGLRSQLGDRAPMGAHGMRRDMPVGTSSNQPGGSTGDAPLPVPGRGSQGDGTANGAIRAAIDRDAARVSGYQRPSSDAVRRDAPGSEFTTRVPGSD